MSHAYYSLHFIALLLGGSPPLSMYALEGAVECPQPQGCLYMCCICVIAFCVCVYVFLCT